VEDSYQLGRGAGLINSDLLSIMMDFLLRNYHDNGAKNNSINSINIDLLDYFHTVYSKGTNLSIGEVVTNGLRVQ